MEDLQIAAKSQSEIKSEVSKIVKSGILNKEDKDTGLREDIIDSKNYEELVKSYTYYAINTKISKNVPKYTEDEIRHNNIKIKSSAVLRILVKWCSELEEKFQNPDYFSERD